MSRRSISAGLTLIALAAVAAGCAAPNRSASDDVNPNVTMGRTPPTETDPADLSSLFGDDKAKDTNSAANSEQLSRLEQQVSRLEDSLRTAMARDTADQRGSTGAATGPGGPAVGVVFADGSETVTSRAQLVFSRVVKDYPLRFVGNQRIADELSNYGCTVSEPGDCIRAVAVYPGVRILAVVGGLEDLSGQSASVTVRLMDTDLDVRYDPIRMELPLTSGRPAQASLEALADAVFLNAQERLRIAPPIFHAVSSEQGQWILNAGRAGGLKEGEVLAVHEGGRLIRSPSGSPAAWVPGPVRGRLRVESIAGADTAIASLMEGKAPRPDDPLVPVD